MWVEYQLMSSRVLVQPLLPPEENAINVKIVNDDSSVISKWSFKLIDDPRVVIYNRHRFTKQATSIYFPFQTSYLSQNNHLVYTMPIVVCSLLFNVPRFFELRTEMRPANVTTYNLDNGTNTTEEIMMPTLVTKLRQRFFFVTDEEPKIS